MSDHVASQAAPARHWGASLAAVCIAQATAIAGFDFTLPFIPLYLQNDLGVHGLGQTALWAGLIGFGPAIPATIFGPLWGRLADRLGYRFMLLRAMLSAALLLSLMGLAPSPWVLLGLRLLQGALTGTVFAAQALVAASAPEKETARSMGLLQMSVFVGATFGPIGGGAMAELLGYRASFFTAGILLAVAAITVFALVSEPVKRVSQKTERDVKTAPSVLSILALPAFAGALGFTLAVQVANTALLPVVPLFVQSLLGTAHSVAEHTGWLLAVSGLAAAGGSYLSGRVHRVIGLKPAVIGALVLSAGLLAPQAMATSFATFLVMRSVAAIALGLLLGLVSTWAATSSPPEAKGTAFGLVGAASSLGFGSGPLMGGALVAVMGIRPVFAISAGMLLILPPMLIAFAAGARFLARAAGRMPALEVER